MGWNKNIHACFALLVIFSTSTSVIRFSCAADTLLPRQSIRDGQTLVSANQKFALGFFSPANSTCRYVGIWYHQVSRLTTVWIANREKPVSGSSGMLTFDETGNLVIMDGMGVSFLVALSTGRNNIAAVVLGTGNLVVRGISDPSRVFWESFDHPTDTYLPGMKLRLEGGRNRLVTSWTSSDNPSSGDFSLGIDPDNPLQISMWKKGSVYWTTGAWNGEAFVNLAPNKTLNYDCYYMTYVANDMEHYFTYSLRNNSIILKLDLDHTGHLRELQWVESSKYWISIWSEPSRQCDVYNYCGAFGTCNMTGVPLCRCMQGFRPESSAEWSGGNFTSGCVRKRGLQCESGVDNDEFLMIPQMRYPANAQKSSARTERDCESECLRNCSCTAYAFSGGCTLWHGNLVNAQEVNQDDTSGNAGTLFLRLASSELVDSKGKKKVIAAVTSSLALLILLSCLCFIWSRRRKRKGMIKSSKEVPLFTSNGGISSRIGGNERDSEFTLFLFSRIADATDNFSASNKLGEGGFGSVYKGHLPEGQEIAVKRLSAGSAQGLEEFSNEIKVIAQLQHRNLVRLLGYCIQGEEKMLVYEFMPNKSLDYFLFDPSRGSQLDWGMRFRVIEGITQGLLYLHKHSRLRIIHRDLKASNILLDDDMNPKISDFGLARIFGSDDMQANTKRVVGTYGYMSPEYALHGLFSIKSDVFSFGVLLLEIVSGKRNTNQYGDSLNLLGYAWELWTDGKWLQLVDPTLGDTYLANELSRCIQVALLCVQESPADRPSMADVITMLSSDSIASPDPKQPAFLTMRTLTEEEPSSTGPQSCSLNDVTFSIVDGR